MNETILFCFVFLSQVLMISWFYARRIVSRRRYMLQNFPAYADTFIVLRDRHDDSASPAEQRQITAAIQAMIAFYFKHVVTGNVDADTAASKAHEWRYLELVEEDQ